MEATDQSVTDYFFYVKNVLGVQTLQSSSIREILQNPSPQAKAAEAILACDIVFLNIRTAQENSVFSTDQKELIEKMIQAMRLGERKHLVLETEEGSGFEPAKFLQESAAKVKSPFVVFFSAKPKAQGIVKNLGTQKYLETFNPGYLLEQPQAKKIVWMDLQKVMKEIGVLL